MAARQTRHATAPDAPETADPAAPGEFGVVGIGASAGGLEACTKLMAAIPAECGLAFIIVQHLDPTHPSLMVELLAGHTKMPVVEATHGMPIAPDHVFVIPPGAYLSTKDGVLVLSSPQARHGARLPFDFLLHALAAEYGARAICVVLSGTGTDGTIGLQAIKAQGGLVIAQEPAEAGYDGMPQSGIRTGDVDLVLPVSGIPDAILRYDRRMRRSRADTKAGSPLAEPRQLADIIALLRETTAHDFTLYKHGTLQRRIERRMAMAAIELDGMARYLDVLRGDKEERELLAKDLLINVTSFFRDPKVFALLEQKTIPDMIRGHAAHGTIRLWIAGCSTGEETYSLTMLFHEQIAAANSGLKLQVFASDVDAHAVAVAREGFYPPAIEAELSAERLRRFFVKEEHGYRIQPDLRGHIVFTVQDVLADPPFSRLDMVSCRNLLIYLQPEAQAKVISLFHFALCTGGILLLGSAETVGAADSRFESISKAERLYRHVGRGRPGELGFANSAGDKLRTQVPQGQSLAMARQTTFAELGRRLLLDCFAPAAVLINRDHECLYTMGATDRYLRVASGHQTSDLLAMARPGMRAKLKAAIQQAFLEKARIVVMGGRMIHAGHTVAFNIDVQPVLSASEDLLLVCFVDVPKPRDVGEGPARSRESSGASDLRQELDATRAELQGALRDLEASSEEHKAISEEALSVNEEFQSTNEELLTSKEELQSLNEELTALNSQLQETLDRQRTTADDLQNVLYSTDLATLFLDIDLKIRFFTPASKALFNIIPGDVGRPLADLRSLAADSALPADAMEVLRGVSPIGREIETPGGVWFTRTVLPYRAHDKRVEGVVITFTDITERKLAAQALEEAKQRAELANLAKTRFLAAASHDLRQPLQTLKLLHGLLAKTVEKEKSRMLVARVGDTLGAMSSMLNALLDINQIEAGVVEAKVEHFPINDMMMRLRDEFAYHAQAQGLELRVVPSSLEVDSDPRLLEQMLRNLLSNALKYTKRGRILLGCRRHADRISVEIWDMGIGIPDNQLAAIFDEYHQLDNAARERSRGLGLGLSIVQRLGRLLGHPVHVQSRKGKGSVFGIDIMLPLPGAVPAGDHPYSHHGMTGTDMPRRIGVILIVEDDPDVRDLLQLVMQDEGHLAVTMRDGTSALDLILRGTVRPDVIVTDYNLPNGLNGLQLAMRARQAAHGPIPTVILTGDISAETLGSIAREKLIQLNKPVKADDLMAIIQRLLPAPSNLDALPVPVPMPMPLATDAGATIFVIDDDFHICTALRTVLEDEGYAVQCFGTGEAFFETYRPGSRHCLLIDAHLPGMSGLALLQKLREMGHRLPAIMITGQSDVPMAVQAMKAGVVDFIEKPVSGADLLASIGRALEQAKDSGKLLAWQESAAGQVSRLTPRQRQIMQLVLAGQPSKNIAADLDISQRTVENHRASIMRKTGAASLPALARLALAASWIETDGPA